jgi:hypothetical protein
VEVDDIENLLADVIFPAVLSLPDLHAVISLRWKRVRAGGEEKPAWIVWINTVAGCSSLLPEHQAARGRGYPPILHNNDALSDCF